MKQEKEDDDIMREGDEKNTQENNPAEERKITRHMDHESNKKKENYKRSKR